MTEKTRKFHGGRFKRVAEPLSKTSAEKQKERLQKQGKEVRVTKGTHKGYDVWVR